MTLNDYQKKASATAKSFDNVREELVCWSLCLCGEAGELANIVKKITWHGYDLDVAKIKDELGDALWYLAKAASCVGIDLDDVAMDNLEKLSLRYPQGFDTERSRNRGSK